VIIFHIVNQLFTFGSIREVDECSDLLPLFVDFWTLQMKTLWYLQTILTAHQSACCYIPTDFNHHYHFCGWVGLSKHSCCSIVFYWIDDDYMFQPCSAIFRSWTNLL